MAVSFRSASEDMKEANITSANAMVQIAISHALRIEAPKFDKKIFDILTGNYDQEAEAVIDQL